MIHGSVPHNKESLGLNSNSAMVEKLFFQPLYNCIFFFFLFEHFFPKKSMQRKRSRMRKVYSFFFFFYLNIFSPKEIHAEREGERERRRERGIVFHKYKNRLSGCSTHCQVKPSQTELPNFSWLAITFFPLNPKGERRSRYLIWHFQTQVHFLHSELHYSCFIYILFLFFSKWNRKNLLPP